MFGGPHGGVQTGEAKQLRPSGDHEAEAFAAKMRALATRLLTKYGVTTEGRKYSSAMMQVATERPSTAVVWDVHARKITITVEDVLWTNILESQSMPTRTAKRITGMVDKVVTDFAHLWKLSKFTADDATPFLRCVRGRHWITADEFSLSDEQLAMVVTLAAGAPVDAVDVTMVYGKRNAEQKQVFSNRPAVAAEHVRSAAWIYSTMGSGKSIVAWFAARHALSDAEWAACKSSEAQWAKSGLNGGPLESLGDTQGKPAPGPTGRVVWIVCKESMIPQWQCVVEKNKGSMEIQVHVPLRVPEPPYISNHTILSPESLKEIATLMKAHRPTVIISTYQSLSDFSTTSQCRAVCIIHDEIESMSCFHGGYRMQSYRTLFISATPRSILESKAVDPTMAGMMFGDGALADETKANGSLRRAIGWSRFAHMNPMPDIQIENSITAIKKMPAILEVSNVTCKIAASFGNTSRLNTAADFMHWVFDLDLYTPLGAGFMNVQYVDGTAVWPDGTPCIEYSEVQAMAAGILEDLTFIKDNWKTPAAWARENDREDVRSSVLNVTNARVIKLMKAYPNDINNLKPEAFKAWVRVREIVAATTVECILCGAQKPCEGVSVALCCGSCFCAECVAIAPVHRPCCFCSGHFVYDALNMGNHTWGPMTALAAAFRGLRQVDPTITKVLVVATGIQKNVRLMFKKLVEFGEPDIECRIHDVWTLDVAKGCMENPEKIDILLASGTGDVDGLDMGVVDAIITVGKVHNKQQLYSRAIRVGTIRREKLRVVQIDEGSHLFTANTWEFLGGYTRAFTVPEDTPVVTYPPRTGEPPLVWAPASTGLAGLLDRVTRGINLEAEGDEVDPTNALTHAVDRVELEFIAPAGAERTVPYVAVEVHTPRLRFIFGSCTPSRQHLDIIFECPIQCEFVPAMTDTVRLELEAAGWMATWGSTATAEKLAYATRNGKLPKAFKGKVVAIRLRIYATTPNAEGVLEPNVFTIDNARLLYEEDEKKARNNKK